MTLYLTKGQAMEAFGLSENAINEATKGKLGQPGLAKTRVAGTPGNCFDAAELVERFDVHLDALLAALGVPQPAKKKGD